MKVKICIVFAYYKALIYYLHASLLKIWAMSQTQCLQSGKVLTSSSIHLMRLGMLKSLQIVSAFKSAAQVAQSLKISI